MTSSRKVPTIPELQVDVGVSQNDSDDGEDEADERKMLGMLMKLKDAKAKVDNARKRFKFMCSKMLVTSSQEAC